MCFKKKPSMIKPKKQTLLTVPYNGAVFTETKIIKDYYNENNNHKLKAVETDLFNWVLKTVLNKVTGSLLPGQVYDILLKGVMPDKMDEILSKISVIESKINELLTKVTTFKYEDVINARNKYVSEMTNAQVRVVAELLSMEGEQEKIEELMTNWGEHIMIGGNSSLTQFINFIDFVVDNKNDGKKLYEIYDGYVYMTTPWENMGYDFREQIRDCDFAVIMSQARLAMLYYAYNSKMNESVKETMLNQIKTAIKKYLDYYTAYKVVRRDDVRVCQINGCKIEIKKDLEVRHYNDVMSWFPKETNWWEPDYSGLRIPDRLEGAINNLVFGSDVKGNYYGLFTEDEINVLKNYYNGKYSNIISMLKTDANMNINVDMSKNVGIMVQDYPWRENEHWYNRNYFIYARIVKANDSFNTDWRKVGCAWIDRGGFFNAHEIYKWWDTFYWDNVWLMPHITKRL